LRRLASLLTLSLLAVSLGVFPARAQTAESPVVRALMFWKAGCGLCEDVIQNILPPIQNQYGAQLDLRLMEIVTMQDVDNLYTLAATYGIPKEKVGVPFLILDEIVLIGPDQIHEKLPSLIDDYLTRGGADWPSNPLLADFLRTASPASLPTSGLPAVTETPLLADTAPVAPAHMQSNGFTLAIVIMVGMIAVTIYSLIAFALGNSFSLPNWADWLIPALIVIGIGVAAYLSFVETQSVDAMCGPVGDCNTVQQSRYARLFDVLPVGVLGLLGYFALLAAWLTRRFIPKLEKPAAIGFFGMAFFAAIFSLYLTYLEPFVIGAVCIWCLSSAIIVTLLFLLGTPPVIRQFAFSDEDESYADET